MNRNLCFSSSLGLKCGSNSKFVMRPSKTNFNNSRPSFLFGSSINCSGQSYIAVVPAQMWNSAQRTFMLFSLCVKWSHFNQINSCHRKWDFLSGCPPLTQCYPVLVITTQQTGHRTTKGSPPHNNCFISDFYLSSDQLLFYGLTCGIGLEI